MTDDEIARSFIIIECYSNGAFPKRIVGPDGGLSFPHEYGEYYITGWEYLVAREYGLFHSEKIHSIRYSKQTISFKDYVTHWYQRKSSIKKKDDPINYTIAKIMMNSLYGKLAQNITKYYDYRIMHAGSNICEFEASKNNPAQCTLCDMKDNDHGW